MCRKSKSTWVSFALVVAVAACGGRSQSDLIAGQPLDGGMPDGSVAAGGSSVGGAAGVAGAWGASGAAGTGEAGVAGEAGAAGEAGSAGGEVGGMAGSAGAGGSTGGAAGSVAGAGGSTGGTAGSMAGAGGSTGGAAGGVAGQGGAAGVGVGGSTGGAAGFAGIGPDGGFVIPDAGAIAECATCLQANCSDAFDTCYQSPACVDGIQCAVTQCVLTDGGASQPDPQCLMACFNGDVQAMLSAVSLFECVTGVCGSVCTMGNLGG